MFRRPCRMTAVAALFAVLPVLPDAFPAAALPSVTSATTGGLHVRVMTYNVLKGERDGTRAPSGLTIAPWAKRRPGVIRLIRDASPDVIAIQEGSAWVSWERGPRQVDDLVSHLGGTYALVSTEIPPSQPHYLRTGRYIMYRTSSYRTVGSGGHWDVGDVSWAAYQVLENRSTGQRFLFVSAHLFNGRGLRNDRRRLQEARTLIGLASQYARNWGVPVVYAGDFNSHGGPQIALDGPRKAMHAADYRDARDIARHRANVRFDSANQYMRRPPAYGENLDHIYVPRGIRVTTWREELHLTDGHFTGTIPSDHNPVVASLVFTGSVATP